MKNPIENKRARPDVSGLIAGLAGYNKYFSLGETMARGMISHFERNDSSEMSEEDLQRKKLEELKRKYGIVLNDLGLSLEAVNAPITIFGQTHMSEEEIRERTQAFSEETGITHEDVEDENSYEFKRAAQFIGDLQEEAGRPIRLTEMRINLSDSQKFISYLSSLKNIGVLPAEKEALVSIASILERQFVGQYDVSDPKNDRFLTLIGSLEKIIALYEELGLTASVLKLKELLEISRRKYLKEFLVVERKYYLLPHDQGFGPARWHTDMTPELYKARWNEAIDIYRQILDNPNAGELSERLKRYLSEAIEIAEKDIKAKPRKTDYEKDNFPEFLKTLELARKKLSE